MFGSYDLKSVVAFLDYDPGADDEIPVFVAPQKCTVISAVALTTNAVVADATNYFAVVLKKWK